MIDLNKPLKTRDGCAVRILATDLAGMYPIAFAIKDRIEGHEVVQTCTLTGQVYAGSGEGGEDLVNINPLIRLVDVLPGHRCIVREAINSAWHGAEVLRTHYVGESSIIGVTVKSKPGTDAPNVGTLWYSMEQVRVEVLPEPEREEF